MDGSAQYVLAYALTSSAGIRAVLPLALVSVAAHLGYMHMSGNFAWVGSPLAMAVLVGMALVELFADKVPLLDHVLHVVQVVTKPAAAAILAGGVMHPQSREVLIGLMVLGALNALGIHAATSSVRVASTATTAGIANPFISVFEDVAAAGVAVLAFAAPFIAAALCLAATLAAVFLVRSTLRHRRRQTQPQ